MSSTTALMMTAETGLTLTFSSGIFLLLFLFILYVFWPVKKSIV